ncbi:hypothetical protein V1522DRAFT_417796 [Lipomyces starkeyi]
MVQAGFNDLNSLVAAFQGTNVIFGVTDFWAIFKDEKSHTIEVHNLDLPLDVQDSVIRRTGGVAWLQFQ